MRVFIYAFTILFTLAMIAASVISTRVAAQLLLNTSFEWLLVASSASAFLFVLYSLHKGWPRHAVWSLIFSIWLVLLLHEWTLAPALSRYQPVEKLSASIPATATRVYTSYAASGWASALTFHLPPGTKVTRLDSDNDGATLQAVLKNEQNVFVLLKEEEYERLRASGISLREVAEGETLSHGGLTINTLRRPETERLRIVQSSNQASER
jgi:hypothetical protein